MRDDYPLYDKWRGIVEYLIELCGKYPKNVRFTLCDRIVNTALDVLEAILEAIYARQKVPILQAANLRMEKICALMQVSVNKKYISLRQYDHICTRINESGRMMGGWIRSCVGQGT